MVVKPDQIVRVTLPPGKALEAIKTSTQIVQSIVDRGDLHSRDYLERFIDCLIGEVAECMVIQWLSEQNKYVESAVNKTSTTTDIGHDIWLKNMAGEKWRCSVKSSISWKKNTPTDILNTFTLATNPKEVRDINIQVYFWLELNSPPRTVVPSLKNAAIFAWASSKDLSSGSFASYKGEQRKAPDKNLVGLRPMVELLSIIR